MRQVALDDKYTAASGRVYLTGTQTLTRLPMLQRLRDQTAGLNTAGLISGYRGSPLGGLDQSLWAAKKHLAAHHITFQPGVNEDLAATALWGSQQVNLFPNANYDGVFGMWYGKGPGVDRSGDVFRHANAAGSSRYGGVLVIAGDDHAAKSSSLPHQTDHVFKAVMMPLLFPASIQEYIDYGLHGWALSRYSGCWVAFKALNDTVEASASVNIDPLALQIAIPTDFALPPGGLNIRWPDPPLVQESRLIEHKLYAAAAYCRANGLNRIVIDSPQPRLGIITSGKSYLDVRQAFDELGIDDALAALIGIRLYKVGMVWPLEADGVRRFAEGLEEILVVEEKRQLIEYQLKEELYNWRESVRPRVIGKFDEKGEWSLPHGEWLLPATSELSVAQIARAIASRIRRFFTSNAIESRLAILEAKQKVLATPLLLEERKPTYCSGCPHNTSTVLPDGSRALAGIGCHYMATWLRQDTTTASHMGGEGVTWVGQAPFTQEKHVFANLGDGTYFHSGSLAIRQAVSAGVSITYKILFNDAVAMTGGQPVDGTLTVPVIARQLAAEGVKRIVVVSDDPQRFARGDLADDVQIRHRDQLDAVQRELRDWPGVSALIYDQVCATEKRRRRKRGLLAEPTRHIFINEWVCEGCGDCSVQSNCLSVVPVDTEFGRKRAIDQSACNKDYSCLKGFCPSFVTVEGGSLRKRMVPAVQGGVDLPLPELPEIKQPYDILITGIGGTGVVTLSALLGMAAHLDGKGVSALDMAGLAQKFGSVYSHIRIARRQEDIHASRIATSEARLIIGGDLMVSGSNESLSKMQAGRTVAVVNSAEAPTAEFIHDPDWRMPAERLRQGICEACGGAQSVTFFDAHHLAEHLLGDTIFANLLLLGCAWQKCLLPVSLEAIDRAIELNGVSVEKNRLAFTWGRRIAIDPAGVERQVQAQAGSPNPNEQDTDTLIRRRAEFLADYQNAAYAARYRSLVEAVGAAEAAVGSVCLRRAVAVNYFKLLAVKDEYEVARLYASNAFHDRLAEVFEGDYKLYFHLAPPLLDKIGAHRAVPAKRQYGPWMMGLLRGLAHLKFLRGSILDPFGYTSERRIERQLIADYEADVQLALRHLTAETLDAAQQLLQLPEKIRGYGHVRLASVKAIARRRLELRMALSAPPPGKVLQAGENS